MLLTSITCQFTAIAPWTAPYKFPVWHPFLLLPSRLKLRPTRSSPQTHTWKPQVWIQGQMQPVFTFNYLFFRFWNIFFFCIWISMGQYEWMSRRSASIVYLMRLPSRTEAMWIRTWICSHLWITGKQLYVCKSGVNFVCVFKWVSGLYMKRKGQRAPGNVA